MTTTHMTHAAVGLRRATESDAHALARRAALDSAPVPSGDVMVAEVGTDVRPARKPRWA
jgi:hypothetical protein